jgi:hypothetical protein
MLSRQSHRQCANPNCTRQDSRTSNWGTTHNIPPRIDKGRLKTHLDVIDPAETTRHRHQVCARCAKAHDVNTYWPLDLINTGTTKLFFFKVFVILSIHNCYLVSQLFYLIDSLCVSLSVSIPLSLSHTHTHTLSFSL